ncbi:5-formyltetrahydrofolate cyclo-ligase [Lysobacter xanthus]
MSAAVELPALRRDIRARRSALSPAFRIAAAQQLGARLCTLPLMPPSGFVAGYWAVDGEIALHAWQTGLSAEHRYCLPVLRADGLLGFAPWRPGATLVTNRFGIPEPDVAVDELLEPSALSAIVMPLVAFDGACHRVGMGGGWYDRTLAPVRDLAERPVLIGVGYELQRVDRLVPAAWDVPLDAVCTESATYLAER